MREKGEAKTDLQKDYVATETEKESEIYVEMKREWKIRKKTERRDTERKCGGLP